MGGRTARLYVGKLCVRRIGARRRWGSTVAPFEATRGYGVGRRGWNEWREPRLRCAEARRKNRMRTFDPYASTTKAKRVSRTQPGSAGL